MKVKEITFTALMAAVCCILGPLSIPIGTIPVTLGVLAVYLCIFTLGARLGSIAVAVYLLLGAAGLPVFSGFQGGVAKLAGPTGGYLIGFLIMAIVSGVILDIAWRFNGAKRYVIQVVGMIIGLAVCYMFGTVWFMVTAHVSLIAGLTTCVIPFLPFDAIKIAFAAVAGNAIHAALVKAHLQVR